MNATHQTASKTWHALRFVDTEISKLKVFQEQVHHHLPLMEEICQFYQAIKWKDERTNSCCHSRTVVLAPLHDPPQEFKQLFRPIVLSEGQVLQKHLCINVHGCMAYGKFPDLRVIGRHARIM